MVFSNLLKKLRPGRAITVELIDGRIVNMGVDEIDEDLNIHFYTRKGLDELFDPNRNEEEVRRGEEIKQRGKDYLTVNQYFDVININDILKAI